MQFILPFTHHGHTRTPEEVALNAVMAADPSCEGSTCLTAFMAGEDGWVECTLSPLHDGGCVCV